MARVRMAMRRLCGFALASKVLCKTAVHTKYNNTFRQGVRLHEPRDLKSSAWLDTFHPGCKIGIGPMHEAPCTPSALYIACGTKLNPLQQVSMLQNRCCETAGPSQSLFMTAFFNADCRVKPLTKCLFQAHRVLRMLITAHKYRFVPCAVTARMENKYSF
eukprot:1160438-Pelagomonas_calceolata.AAC.3